MALNPQRVSLPLENEEETPISVTNASLLDTRTGFSLAASDITGAMATWSAVYNGSYELVFTDAEGTVYRSPVDVPIQNVNGVLWLPHIKKR